MAISNQPRVEADPLLDAARWSNRRRLWLGALLLCALVGLFWLAQSSEVSFREYRAGSGLPVPDASEDDKRPFRFYINSQDFAPLPKAQPGDWLSVHDEPGQNFRQFVASRPNRPSGKRSVIYLQPVGELSPGASPSLDILVEHTQLFFALEVKLLPPLVLAKHRIKSRKNLFTKNPQLLAPDILKALYTTLPDDAYCLIGLTTTDLYPEPSWNFVFGQAMLRDRVGVYSFARYDPAFYGETEKAGRKKVILLRSLKVMAHEIAHMFGMQHCTAYHCLVNGSNHLEEADEQPLFLCPICLKKLQWSTGFDPEVRYLQLQRFYQQLELTEQANWLTARLKHTALVPITNGVPKP